MKLILGLKKNLLLFFKPLYTALHYSVLNIQVHHYRKIRISTLLRCGGRVYDITLKPPYLENFQNQKAMF